MAKGCNINVQLSTLSLPCRIGKKDSVFIVHLHGFEDILIALQYNQNEILQYLIE